MTRPGEASLSSSTMVAIQTDAAAQPAAGEIEHIVDQPRHPHDRGLHHRDDLMFFLGLGRSVENVGAGADGCERVAQIVAEPPR